MTQTYCHTCKDHVLALATNPKRCPWCRERLAPPIATKLAYTTHRALEITTLMHLTRDHTRKAAS